MTTEQVTALTTAFAPGQLFDSWIDLAPFILAGVGVLLAIGIVTGVVRSVRKKLQGARG